MISTIKKISGILFILAITTGPLVAQVPVQPQDEMGQTEISDIELEKFAQAFKSITILSQQAKQQLGTVVQEEDMEIERFNQIHQASLDPQIEINVTKEEEERYKRVSPKVEEMQIKFQKQMEDLILEQNLTIEKYKQIATELLINKEFQERLRDYFKEKENSQQHSD